MDILWSSPEPRVMPRPAPWPTWPVDAAVRGHGAPLGQSKELHECPLTRLMRRPVGVAVIGTIFFGRLGPHSFTQAFTHGLPVTAGLFLASAALSLLLPKTAVADEHG
jgi:hypothetical protein